MKKQDETALPSLAADFPVSRFQARGNKKGLKIPATCGLKCAASLQSSSPAGCLAKMLLGSSIWGSTKRFLTWKKRATLFKHSYYQLAVSARGISAQELLSSALMFPTPLASDNNKKQTAAVNMNVYLSDNGIFRKKNKNGAIWSLPLSAAVFYMTPVASDGIRSKFPPEVMRKSKDGANLAAQVILEEQPQSETAALNPDWVEWLMGFPLKWTDANCGNGSLSAFPV